jgi:Sulfate permease and related transporters (MFS superfamily)
MYKDGSLQSTEQHRLRGCRHIAVVRFDGALFFANASYLDEQIIKFRNDMPDLRYILLDASGINDIDASGEEELALLVDRLHAAGYGFAVCNAKGPILAVLDRTHLFDKIGREKFLSGYQGCGGRYRRQDPRKHRSALGWLQELPPDQVPAAINGMPPRPPTVVAVMPTTVGGLPLPCGVDRFGGAAHCDAEKYCPIFCPDRYFMHSSAVYRI